MKGRYLHASDYHNMHQSLSAPLSHTQPLFAVHCEMLINPENVETLSAGNTSIFNSVHSMDLKFVHVDHMYVLEIFQRFGSEIFALLAIISKFSRLIKMVPFLGAIVHQILFHDRNISHKSSANSEISNIIISNTMI